MFSFDIAHDNVSDIVECFTAVLQVGMHQFHQQNYWRNRNAKVASKMLA